MAIIPSTYAIGWYDPSQPGGVVTALNNNANTATSNATQYTMEDVINTVSYTGGSIDGSGAQYTLPIFTDTNTITNLPLGTSGQTLSSGGAGADPSWGVVVRETAGMFYADNLYIANNLTLADPDSFGANIIIGKGAGASITQSVYNTLILGVATANSLTASENFTCIGHNNSDTITQVGSSNTAVGAWGHLSSTNQTGNYATSFGYQTNVGSGSEQTVLGPRSGRSGGNDSQGGCVIIGYQANYGGGVGTTQYSTVVGYRAANTKVDGINNTIIGAHAEASTTTVDNEITLGDSSIATIRAQVTVITALSDERDKKDIVDLDQGLDMVNQLKPRQFVWDHRAEKRIVTEIVKDADGKDVDVDKEVEIYSARKGTKDIGFVAQELQTVDNEWMQLVSTSNPDKLEASYGKLVPVLVKAIQELSAKVTVLENK